MSNPVYRLDFTISCVYTTQEINQPQFVESNCLQSFLQNMCNNFVFQMEETTDEHGDPKNRHWQGRINLRKKKRKNTFFNEMTDYLTNFYDQEAYEQIYGSPLWWYNIHITETNNKCRGFSYVMKSDTVCLDKIGKPIRYTDKSMLAVSPDILQEYQLLEWHWKYLRKITNFYSLELTHHEKYRAIYNIIDTHGHSLKTSFVKYLLANFPQEVCFLDCWSTPQQLQSSIANEGINYKAYIFDIPRAFGEGENKFTGSKLIQLVALIERIKDGGPLRSSMYGDQTVHMQPNPCVLVFSNWPIQTYDGQYFSPGRLIEDHIHVTEEERDQIRDFVPVVPKKRYEPEGMKDEYDFVTYLSAEAHNKTFSPGPYQLNFI